MAADFSGNERIGIRVKNYKKALLAMAGDLGGAFGPSLAGVVTQACGDDLQKGVLAGSVFPLVLIVCVLALQRTKSDDCHFNHGRLTHHGCQLRHGEKYARRRPPDRQRGAVVHHPVCPVYHLLAVSAAGLRLDIEHVSPRQTAPFIHEIPPTWLSKASPSSPDRCCFWRVEHSLEKA